MFQISVRCDSWQSKRKVRKQYRNRISHSLEKMSSLCAQFLTRLCAFVVISIRLIAVAMWGRKNWSRNSCSKYTWFSTFRPKTTQTNKQSEIHTALEVRAILSCHFLGWHYHPTFIQHSKPTCPDDKQRFDAQAYTTKVVAMTMFRTQASRAP